MASEAEPQITRPERPSVLPWHAEIWQRLTRDLMRMPHAVLLAGADGLGKLELARRLGETLLCAHPVADAAACGQCRSCMLLAAGTHPDLLMVQPKEDSKVVAVDQVRALGEFLSLKPHTAARKIVILQPADAMNVNAANSLLKVLEEPPLGSVLILVSNQLGRLPATIRSRCARVTCRPPSEPVARDWLRAHGINDQEIPALLAFAEGAPLRAKRFYDDGIHAEEPALRRDAQDLVDQRADPMSCAVRWKTVGAEHALGWLYRFAAGEIRAGVGLGASALRAGGKALDLRGLHETIDVISEARREARGALDELLLLEDVLIRWSRLGR